MQSEADGCCIFRKTGHALMLYAYAVALLCLHQYAVCSGKIETCFIILPVLVS